MTSERIVTGLATSPETKEPAPTPEHGDNATPEHIRAAVYRSVWSDPATPWRVLLLTPDPTPDHIGDYTRWSIAMLQARCAVQGERDRLAHLEVEA